MLTDWDRAGEWMNGIDWIRADGPLEPGTQLLFHSRGKERPSEIAAIDPGRSLTLRSVQGPVGADYTYTVSAAGDGTRLELVADCTITGPMKLLSPLLRWVVKRTDGNQPADLKTVAAAA